MVLTDFFSLEIDETYFVVGSLALLYTAFLIYLFFDFMTRFLGMVLCKLHFKLETSGTIPETPAIYVAPHTAWNDTLLIQGSQRRRVKFFYEEDAHSMLKGFYKIFRVIEIPAVEPLENNRKCLLQIKKCLKKGFSICLFTDEMKMQELIEKIKHSEFFHEMLDDVKCPIIPLNIEKGERQISGTFFERIRKKIHCPAKLTFGKNALPT